MLGSAGTLTAKPSSEGSVVAKARTVSSPKVTEAVLLGSDLSLPS